jgi:hypothetical protein
MMSRLPTLAASPECGSLVSFDDRTSSGQRKRRPPRLPEWPPDRPHPWADLRTDLPAYRVCRHGELADEPTDIRPL